MPKEYDQTDIRTITQTMIDAIENMEKNGADKALLASFRHSVGKPLSQSPDIWNFLFRYMPEKYLSETGRETAGEKAVCTALQMYALYRQGSTFHSSKENVNFGGSLNKIRNVSGDDSLDKRMNMILTADDSEELYYRLRQMVKLCKSRETVDINFAKLAEDLYLWLKGRKERIRLSWAQSYYYQYGKDNGYDKSIETKEERQ